MKDHRRIANRRGAKLRIEKLPRLPRFCAQSSAREIASFNKINATDENIALGCQSPAAALGNTALGCASRGAELQVFHVNLEDEAEVHIQVFELESC